MFSIFSVGFLLGLRHAADADHVLAVTALVSRRQGAAWRLGACWGIGHGVTILLAGLLIVVLKLAIPPRLGLALELAVGLVLVCLGSLNVAAYRRGAAGPQAPALPPAPEGSGRAPDGNSRLAQSAFIGLVHGLAGSGAIALLVAAAIQDTRTACLYLLLFGLGTLVGMLLLSVTMEAFLESVARWWRPAARHLVGGSALLTLALGLYIVYQAGFAGGLFGLEPRWQPR